MIYFGILFLIEGLHSLLLNRYLRFTLLRCAVLDKGITAQEKTIIQERRVATKLGVTAVASSVISGSRLNWGQVFQLI